MMKNILCPLDFSEPSRRALRWAGNLASKLEARLSFLHVIDTSRFSHGGVPAELLERLRHRVEHELSDLACPNRRDVHVEVADGSVYEVILERAERPNVDLLVMSSSGHSGIGRLLKGSLTEKILDHVAIPVLVVADDSRAESSAGLTLRNILMPIDFGTATTEVIHTAFALADRWKAKLIALHVVAPPRETFADRDGLCWMSDEVLEKLEGKLENVRRKQMVSLLHRMHPDTSAVEIIVVEGRTPETIRSIAEENDVDLVLLGAHGHSMRPLGWIGSTCHRMIQSSCRSTLIVKTVRSNDHGSHHGRTSSTTLAQHHGVRSSLGLWDEVAPRVDCLPRSDAK